jgi:hypothetical protein
MVTREQPITTVQEIDARYARIEKQQTGVPAGKPLEVNTQNLGVNANRGPETSWLCTPTPATAGTPAVMLQRDGPGDKAEPLQEETENEESSEEELETVRRVFQGDEEVVAKARVTAWLGESYVSHVCVVEKNNADFSSQKRCRREDKEGLYGIIRLEWSEHTILSKNILWATCIQRGDTTG